MRPEAASLDAAHVNHLHSDSTLTPSTKPLVKKSLNATAAGALADIDVVLGVDREVVREREATAPMPRMAYRPDDLHVAPPEDPHPLVATVRYEPEPLVRVARERQVEH